ncbi:hypothetical protein [Paenibacillus illinoisensis]
MIWLWIALGVAAVVLIIYLIKWGIFGAIFDIITEILWFWD